MMEQLASTPNILNKLLEPVSRCFTTEVARQVAKLRAEPTVQARIAELATKSSDGRLSPGEREEYAAYVEAIDVIATLQAKARTLLAEQADS